jgi:hypothetical protein
MRQSPQKYTHKIRSDSCIVNVRDAPVSPVSLPDDARAIARAT